ncbi:hypothetical protein [Streptomyces sp. NPDC015131]|uniref:hypothetical protein n=1 Tax=Streptomyces sp. NPDC015131 TaxID=3364941 RepID=UPI0037027149
MPALYDRGPRRLTAGLLVLAVPAAVAGALLGSLWLLGVAVWAVIGAFLIEMIR